MTRRRYVVATGDVFDGIALCGPFDDAQTANDYADREGLTPWHIVTLHAPDASTLRNTDIYPPAETDPRNDRTQRSRERAAQCSHSNAPAGEVSAFALVLQRGAL